MRASRRRQRAPPASTGLRPRRRIRSAGTLAPRPTSRHASAEPVPCLCRNRAEIVPTRPQAQSRGVLELFPDTARTDDGELSSAGSPRRHCSRARKPAPRLRRGDAARASTRLPRSRAGRLRLLRDEGVSERLDPEDPRRGGARRRRLHARRDPLRAGGRHPRRPPRHARQQQERRRAAHSGRGRRARGASTRSRRSTGPARPAFARSLVRVTPGIDADTHKKIRTGHHGSKFGLPPDDTIEALRRLPEAEGLHVHLGSQLLDAAAALTAVDWMATFAARARDEIGWELRTLDLGGGLGVPTAPDEPSLGIDEFVRSLLTELERAFAQHGLAQPQVILEPGRSLVARAGVTLYTRRRRQTRAGGDNLGRRRRRHLRQPPPRALRRPLHRAAREPRRGASGGHVRRRRQALRVRRPADRARRAARAPPRRHPRRPGNRRLHARDELDVQRGPTPRGRPRRRRRGARHPPPRDDRRPARAGVLARAGSRRRAARCLYAPAHEPDSAAVVSPRRTRRPRWPSRLPPPEERCPGGPSRRATSSRSTSGWLLVLPGRATSSARHAVIRCLMARGHRESRSRPTATARSC